MERDKKLVINGKYIQIWKKMVINHFILHSQYLQGETA